MQDQEKKKKKGGKAKWILLLILVLLIAAAAVVVPSLLTDNGESIPLIGGAISEANAENARKQDIESILTDAATYADAGDYTNALRTLSGGLNKYPEDAELTAKQTLARSPPLSTPTGLNTFSPVRRTCPRSFRTSRSVQDGTRS